MKKLLLAFALALALGVTPVLAQQVNNPMPNAGIYGAYNSAAPTCVSGTGCWVQTDINGQLKVAVGGSGTTASQVQGNVASGAADSGNPVKVGCVNNTTLPTVANGQRVDCQADTRGGQIVVVKSANGTNSASVSAISGDTASSLAGLWVNNIPLNFNGSAFDRAFTCTQTAVINVTAAATTQIVALGASQIIRVCSFSVAMSAAGTAQFLTGTGTNCGTGTTNLTGAIPLATGTPWTVSSGVGSVFRSTVGGEICVAAVTGNVVGFLTYAQY